MNRIKDYVCFAACFAGLGYIVLWPITTDELGGQPLGAATLCREGGLLEFLCAAPLRLPAGLHVLGFMAAVFVTMRGLAGAVRRSRGNSTAITLAETDGETPPPSRRPRPLATKVKPRSHFGLRGMPR